MWRVKEYWKYGCMCCYEQCPADPSNYYTDNNWDIYEYEECEIPWVNPSLQPSSIPSLQPSPSCLPVTVEVWPDCCPEDISWEVIDANGKLVFVGDGAEDGFMSSLWSQTTCLAVGSYSFIFSDSSWDLYAGAWFKVLVGNEVVIEMEPLTEQYNFDSSLVYEFEVKEVI